MTSKSSDSDSKQESKDDDKTKSTKVEEEEKAKEESVDDEDTLWNELLKCLSKLETGVDGDLSSLSRAVRMLNRFRKRMPATTWMRIVHSLVPVEYRAEFEQLLTLFISDTHKTQIELISYLAGVEFADAEQKLTDFSGKVTDALFAIIAEKENEARKEIIIRQKELAEEREERIKKQKLGILNNDQALDMFDQKSTVEAESTAVAKGAVAVEKPAADANDVEMDNKNKGESPANSNTSAAAISASATAKTQAEKDKVKEIKVTLLPLKESKKKHKFYPETYVLLQLLIALELFDTKFEYKGCLALINKLIVFTKEHNRRTCDLLSSRLYQFQSLCYQRLASDDGTSAAAEEDENKNSMAVDTDTDVKLSQSQPQIRQQFFLAYETACIQQSEPVQSVLINNILRSYIDEHLYSLAHKFAEKAEFPTNSESAQFARYHYYRGRIDCIQLEYTNALYHFQQAIRRAPQTGALAFKIATTRWLIVIQLLMGDIPDRSLFRSLDKSSNNANTESEQALNCKFSNREKLEPFLEISEAVREGELDRYRQCLLRYNQVFNECGLTKVLLRLRHNVIKTGLRKINKSYSRLSLADVAMKLKLENSKDAYFIVGKAIKDGHISATMDYENKCVESTQISDVYSTALPYQQFSTRIKFCLQIHDQAVKSLRYPQKDESEKDEEDEKDNDNKNLSVEQIAALIQKKMDRHNHEDEEDEDEDDK